MTRKLKSLLLVIAFFGVVSNGWAATNAQFTATPGVDYFCESNPRIPLAVHVVRIDRARSDLEFHTTLGGNSRIGMSLLSDQVGYVDSTACEPVAAINGDYFFMERPFAGDPMNLHIRRGGELVSGPGVDRAFFYLDAAGRPHITNAIEAFKVTWPGGQSMPIGLNQFPDSGQSVLYTRAAGSPTRISGVALTLEQNGQAPWLPLRIGESISARIRSVSERGTTEITSNGMVLAVDAKTWSEVAGVKEGVLIKLSLSTTPDLRGTTLAIGGGPTLVRGGKARKARDFVGFQVRNPRTALGWNSSYYYLVQVDGRQPRHSMGMTLEELANYFVKLGCDHALNLDGGGSCATWLAGRIMNNPSQGRERPSANALVLVKKLKPGS